MEDIPPEILGKILDYCPNSTNLAVKRVSKKLHSKFQDVIGARYLLYDNMKKSIEILIKANITPDSLKKYLQARYHANAFAWAFLYAIKHAEIEHVYWLSEIPENQQVLGVGVYFTRNKDILNYIFEKLTPDRRYVFHRYCFCMNNTTFENLEFLRKVKEIMLDD